MGTKRKSEMWISNNRVLVGGNKKLSGRNPNFDTDETKLLISLWGDPKVQKTLITTHKKHPVIVRLAEKMREYGYYRSAEEINTRIKNLKCFYNRIKKDLDGGVTGIPTWKHFFAMEEIMTRPIFSVRPDEIPKPSLRYKMEEEADAINNKNVINKTNNNINNRTGKNLRPIRNRKKIVSEDDESSFDEDDDDDDSTFEEDEDDLEKDNENKSDNDDSFTQEIFDDEEEEENKRLQPKKTKLKQRQQPIETEKDNSNGNTGDNKDQDIEETTLVMPKQEPIDVDEIDTDEMNKDRDVEDPNDIFPKLSAYLQLASNNTISSSSNCVTQQNNKIVTTIAGTRNSNDTNSLKLSQPIMIKSQQNNLGSQGKISLVPTNFLLKPHQQQIQIRPQTQHILYTKPNVPGNQTITTSASGQVPMKVLFVNTLQKNTGTTTSTPTESVTKVTTTNGIKTNIMTPKIASVQSAQRAVPSTINNLKTNSGFRNLLSQLVQIETSNLEVNRQRLELDKQRLEFEKSIAEKIMNALPMFQQQKPQPQPEVAATPTTPNTVETVPLLVPKLEKED